MLPDEVVSVSSVGSFKSHLVDGFWCDRDLYYNKKCGAEPNVKPPGVVRPTGDTI